MSNLGASKSRASVLDHQGDLRGVPFHVVCVLAIWKALGKGQFQIHCYSLTLPAQRLKQS